MQKNNKVMDVEMDPYYGDVEEISMYTILEEFHYPFNIGTKG